MVGVPLGGGDPKLKSTVRDGWGAGGRGTAKNSSGTVSVTVPYYKINNGWVGEWVGGQISVGGGACVGGGG